MGQIRRELKRGSAGRGTAGAGGGKATAEAGIDGLPEGRWSPRYSGACSWFLPVLTGRRPAVRYPRHGSNWQNSDQSAQNSGPICPEVSAITVLVAATRRSNGGE